MMHLKIKTFSFILILSILASEVFAGGFIKAGETFKAKEDVRYFTKSESIELLKQLNELEELRKSLEIYKENEEKYKEAIKEKNSAIKSLQESNTYFEFSIKQYKGLIENLQTLTRTQNESMIELTKVILQVKASSNTRAKANFFTGFVAPILGAWGLSKIK
jgi:hypothetical protein